ncbi:MAG TPA: hypothetical protein PLX15_05550 [Candidatus Woesearchaeota archaeon]|nr:hypothetical protein [Candidatus Woesearchaeota archaeon]
MGLFESIIQKFKSKESSKESIASSEIENWLSIKKLSELKKADELSKPLLQKILEENKILSKNITEFQTKELENKKVESRLIEISKSNKEIFIMLIKRFVDDITSNSTHENKKDLFEKILLLTQSLSKATHKITMILENFYSHDIDKISRNITIINELSEKGKLNYETKNLKILNEIEIDYTEFKSQTNLIENLSKELSLKEANLQSLKKDQDLISKEIQSLKNQIDYKNLKALEKQLSLISQEKEKKRSEFIEKFLPIEKALKKYNHISLEEKFITILLNDPLKTFLNPEESTPLKIIELFKDLKKALENNSLNLDPKKLEKTQQELCEYSLAYIKNLRKEFNELETKENLLIKDIQKSQVSTKLKELYNKKQSIENELPKINSDIENLKNKIPNNPKNNLNSIISKAKEIGIELQII